MLDDMGMTAERSGGPSSLLAFIVGSSDDAITGKTIDGTITIFNHAAETMYGYMAEEVLGQPITILADPEQPQEMEEILARVRRGEKIPRCEVRRRRKDGTIIDVSLTISPIHDSSGELIGASSISRDITEQKLTARLRQSLIGVGQNLASTLDFEEVLTRAVAQGTEVLGADAAALEVRKETGWLVQESRGLAGHLRGLILPEREAPLAMGALRERKAFAVADVSSDGRFRDETRPSYPVRSALVVPLVLRNQMIGVIFFTHSAKRRFFQEPHLEFAQNLSVLVALALENARLYSEKKMMVHKLETILLNIPSELPGVEISYVYRSATLESQVGGDFYDVFEAKYGQIALLIGDVCGHGVEAARIAALVKDTIYAFAHQFRRPRLVLRETNRLLNQKRIPGFVTVFLGFLDPESGLLTYSSAGHPPPLLANRDEVIRLEGFHSPLGAMPESSYRDTAHPINPGNMLVLYTDGVIEARRGDDIFGEERLVRALGRNRHRSVDALPSCLLQEVLSFCGDTLTDDTAMLAVNYVGGTQLDKEARARRVAGRRSGEQAATRTHE